MATDTASISAEQLYTDDFLNKMRLTGDPLADDAAAFLFKNENSQVAVNILRGIATNASFKEQDFPPEISHYFKDALTLPAGMVVDEEKLKIAANVFDLYGFHVVGLLFFKSLPGGYMAPYPASVMGTTQLIETQAARRVFETAQMIFDVLTSGWHEANGRGIATILKVRLMHAGMRFAILKKVEPQWASADDSLIKGTPLGVPINQEDTVLTLNLFSIIILEGMEQFGVKLTDEQKEAFFYNWWLVGHYLGISPELNPQTIEDAWVLQKKICARLYKLPNAHGPALTRALLDVLHHHSPKFVSHEVFERITVFVLKDDFAYESLGFKTPTSTQVFQSRLFAWELKIMFYIRKLTGRLLHPNALMDKIKSTSAEESHRAASAIVKALHMGHVFIDSIKMDFFESICKHIVSSLEKEAKLSTNNKFFINDSLIKAWDLSGFNMNEVEDDKK